MKKLLALLMISSALQAESPATLTLTCPIGGERFEMIVPALSCAAHLSRTMSFAPTSSCNLTAMQFPQCTRNFLPMYKEFAAGDLALLQDFMVTESYDSAVDRSRYYLAYIVESYIGEDDPSLPFSLLLHGLWFDPDNTFSDSGYLEAFLYESTSELNRGKAWPSDLLQAITAFALIKAGRMEAATQMLALSKESGRSEPMLTAYQAAIASCIADSSSEYCNPQTLVPLD